MTGELEAWLRDVPVLALKAFADDMPNGHGAKKDAVIAYILDHPPARERALESMRVEQEVLGRDVTTKEV